MYREPYIIIILLHITIFNFILFKLFRLRERLKIRHRVQNCLYCASVMANNLLE